jgi:hypothetical protein
VFDVLIFQVLVVVVGKCEPTPQRCACSSMSIIPQHLRSCRTGCLYLSVDTTAYPRNHGAYLSTLIVRLDVISRVIVLITDVTTQIDAFEHWRYESNPNPTKKSGQASKVHFQRTRSHLPLLSSKHDTCLPQHEFILKTIWTRARLKLIVRTLVNVPISWPKLDLTPSTSPHLLFTASETSLQPMGFSAKRVREGKMT